MTLHHFETAGIVLIAAGACWYLLKRYRSGSAPETSGHACGACRGCPDDKNEPTSCEEIVR